MCRGERDDDQTAMENSEPWPATDHLRAQRSLCHPHPYFGPQQKTHAPSMHTMCTQYAPHVHPICTQHAPNVHTACTQHAHRQHPTPSTPLCFPQKPSQPHAQRWPTSPGVPRHVRSATSRRHTCADATANSSVSPWGQLLPQACHQPRDLAALYSACRARTAMYSATLRRVSCTQQTSQRDSPTLVRARGGQGLWAT